MVDKKNTLIWYCRFLNLIFAFPYSREKDPNEKFITKIISSKIGIL